MASIVPLVYILTNRSIRTDYTPFQVIDENNDVFLGSNVGVGRKASAKDQDIQEADRGRGGDRRPQLGQVPEGSAGVGRGRGKVENG